MSVDLPAPDRPDEEHEVALRDDEVDVLERVPAVRVALRDVVEHEDRAGRRRGGRGRVALADARRRWATASGRLGTARSSVGHRSRWVAATSVDGGLATSPDTGTVGEATTYPRPASGRRDRQPQTRPGEIGR